MNKIVVSGYYGFGNAGDEAMLSAMIDGFRGIDPAVGITVISGNPQDTRDRHQVEAVHRCNLFGIVRQLLCANLLVSGGGSLLQDVTSRRSFYYYLGTLFLAYLLRCPFMLYAQGIGPICRPWPRRAMRFVADRAAAIDVRDEGSRQELRDLGISRPPIRVTADPVLSLQPVSLTAGSEKIAKTGLSLEKPLVGISVRDWHDCDGFSKELAGVADRLSVEHDAQIVFLSMQSPEDVRAAQLVIEKMHSPALVLNGSLDTRELLSMIGNLDLLLGVRLHALIFAAVMDVPMVGISYDPKIERFLQMIGEPETESIRKLDGNRLLNRCLAVWRDETAKEFRREKIAVLREKAGQSALQAMRLASGGRN